MSCEPFFSLSNLNGSSLEREIGFSFHCIPNETKAAIFIVSLVIFSLMSLVTGFFFLRDVLRNPEISSKKKMDFLIFFACFGEVVIQILYLCGVDSRARYLLYAIPFGSISAVARSFSILWFEAMSNIANFQVHAKEGFYGKVHFLINFLGITHLVLYVLLWTVLPMIFYQDPFVLNWLYAAMIFHSGLVGVSNVTVLFITTVRLEKLFRGSERFQELDLGGAMKKLRTSKLVWYVCYVMCIPLLLFPVWIIVTVTPTDPGLKGVFYFHLVLLNLVKVGSISSAFIIVYKVTKTPASGSRGTSSSHSAPHGDSKAGPQKDSSSKPRYSFTVEELLA